MSPQRIAWEKIFASVVRVFSHPRYGWLIAVLIGVVLALLTLSSGYFSDDYFLHVTLRGENPHVAPLNAFQFVPGPPETTQAMMDEGPFPWFMDPEMKVRFFRPLSSATMWLDVQLFGHAFAMHHLHSVLWYGLLLWAAALIYRRVFPGAIGILLLLLFAMDEAHLTSVGWWANRNALVAAVPAFFALAAHLRWRMAGWKPGLPLSLLGYTLGLFGGETALSVLAYVLAFELVGNGDPLLKRLRCVLPASMLAVGYVLWYKLSGHGVENSGIYLDPTAEPWVFVRELPMRFLQLLSAHFTMVPSDVGVFLPLFKGPMVFLGVMIVVLTFWLWRKIVPTLPPEERHAFRWLLLGACFSAAPVLATAPTVRLLLVPSFGGAAVLLLLIRYGWTHFRQPGASRIAVGTGMILIVMHLIISPLLWPIQTFALNQYSHHQEMACLNAEIDEADLENQYVFLLNSPDPILSFYPMLMRQCYDRPQAEVWRYLTCAPYDHQLTRTAVNAFEMEVIAGSMGISFFDHLFRSPHRPMQTGDQVRLSEMTVDVVESTAFGPNKIRFTFDAPLESSKYQFLFAEERTLRQFNLPSLGESVALPAAKYCL